MNNGGSSNDSRTAHFISDYRLLNLIFYDTTDWRNCQAQIYEFILACFGDKGCMGDEPTYTNRKKEAP